MRRKQMKKEKIFLVILFVLALAVFIGDRAAGQGVLKILISNDDGVDAPGIKALFEKLSPIADVTVAAPAENFSGAGHGISSSDPIMVKEFAKNGKKWFAIQAKPATCVRLALESLLGFKPDLVVSGINRGENLGVVTFYSGTLGCAREAAFKGIPAVAFSLEHGKVMDYEGAADFAAQLVTEMKTKKLDPHKFLNVNYPAILKNQIRGVLVTRQDTRPSYEYYEKRTSPEGQLYFWPMYKTLDQGSDSKTDVWALENGYISITPLHFDQTDYPQLKNLRSWKIVRQK
jgi:5'-nucleotidase